MIAAGKVAAYVQKVSQPTGLVLCDIPSQAAQQPKLCRTAGVPHIGVKIQYLAMQTQSLMLGLASLQCEAAAGRSRPPVERWHPSHCGEIDIRIARDGTWFHQETPIGRKEIVRLFSTILRKDPDGYFLVTPVEKLRIRVEDAPFTAVLLDVERAGPDQTLHFTTNVGDTVAADPDNPIRVETDSRTGEPAPYVHVRSGLEARISRNVFYQLADLAVPQGDTDVLGVWSSGVFFALGHTR